MVRMERLFGVVMALAGSAICVIGVVWLVRLLLR
jgi:hypothetical protein